MHNIRTCSVTAVLLPVILVAVPVSAGSEGLGGLRLSPSEGVITLAQSTPKQSVAGSGDKESSQAAGAKVRAGTGSKFAGGPPKAATVPVVVKMQVEMSGGMPGSRNAGQAGTGKAQNCTKTKSQFCGGPPKAVTAPIVAEMQVEVPSGGKPNTPNTGQAGANTGKSGGMNIKKRCDEGTLKGEACDCIKGTLEGKACDGYRALLLKKMEDASKPVDAGEMAKKELKHVQDTAQAELKNVVGNLKEIEGVVDAGMPGALDERDVTAPDLGDSDSLGSLD